MIRTIESYIYTSNIIYCDNTLYSIIICSIYLDFINQHSYSHILMLLQNALGKLLMASYTALKELSTTMYS